MKTHSKEFWKKKFAEYKAELKGTGVKPITKRNFMLAWEKATDEGVTNKMKHIVYSTKYGTAYKYALAEKRALRGIGINVKLEELKKMDTQDFADRFRAEIDAAYNAEFARTGSKKAARELISTYWFGSP